MLGRVTEALVGPDDDGERLDAFVASLPHCPSRSACARLIEEGRVTINSTSALSKEKSTRLKTTPGKAESAF